MPRWAKWALGIFIVLVLFAPAAAAGLWTEIGHLLHNALQSVSMFTHQVKHK